MIISASRKKFNRNKELREKGPFLNEQPINEDSQNGDLPSLHCEAAQARNKKSSHTIDHNRRRVEDKKYNKDENKSKTLGKVQTEDRRGKKKKSEEETGKNENFLGRPAAKFLSTKFPSEGKLHQPNPTPVYLTFHCSRLIKILLHSNPD